MRGVTIMIGFLLLIAATFIISFCYGNSNVLCIETEKQALLKFKHDLVAESNRLSSWVEDEDCCLWMGVLCDNFTGHVNRLHLGLQVPDWYAPEPEWEAYRQSVLGGKINPSLLDLKHLNFLDLSNNDFGDMQIPEFIGSIKSLTYLNLSRANFGGAIPHKLGNLSKLHYLDLKQNFKLFEAKTLQWVSGLSSLQYLDLSSANLSQATDWQQVTINFPSLVELHLSNCELHNDPSLIGTVNDTSLAILDLSWNWLSSIPTWILSLRSIESIDLHGNNFGGVIPNGLQNLSSLRFLDLSYNSFSSSLIPSWLSNLYRLHFLALGYNGLQGNISSVIGNLSSLTHLDLSGNMLEGIEPKCLESLCRLREIDFSYNKFDHELSEMIEILPRCSLDKLESLKLAYTKLSGHLVDEIGTLSSLTVLDVSGNRLSGSLSQSLLEQLGNLKVLDISSNLLEGNVSEMHFSNLTRLRELVASNNMFTFQPSPNWIPPFQCEIIRIRNWNLGPQFPQWLQFQKKLSVLDISHARISGVIPIWFWNLSTQFQYINLSNNQLVGRISYLSPSIVDLSSNQFTGSLPRVSPKLWSLLLSNNLFSGSLSHFVCNYSSIKGKLVQFLDLGSNLLSGLIPDCWKNWSWLSLLNLSNNNLTGEIPKSLGYMGFILSLNLRNNSLFGEVPSTLQHCTNLYILDLSENQFSGSIPTWIGDKLSKLVVLNLRSNKFEAHIPTQICALNSLHILDFAYNNISGAIPNCLSNLSAMTSSETLNPRVGGTWGIFLLGDFMILDALVMMKGREDEYSTTLGLVTSIDLSANKLTGEISKELGNLIVLASLNLSGNLLTGNIPESIGNMKLLESLDLSMNRLYGEIPSSLSNLNFLNHFNLSYNNLTGLIPSGTQLQGFDSLSYIGNRLCGPPLTKNCSKKGSSVIISNERRKVNWLYVSIGVGFVMGFWGVVAPLFYIRSWRMAYYQKLDHVGRKLYVFWATIGM